MYKKSYLLDMNELEPGDIILSSSKSFPSVGIRLMTLGKYSHAALYVGGTTIEATLNGVFSKNPQRLLFENEKQVAVFRYKKKLTDTQIKQVCDFARSKCGSLYALPEAITMKIRKTLKLRDTEKQFCSRLVAKAYEHAGVDLGNLRTPAFCTPKQLGLCNVFFEVDNVLKEASPEEVEFAERKDPNLLHQEQTFFWLGKVRELARNHSKTRGIEINTLNDVNKFLIEYPEFDHQISEFVKQSGYLGFYKHDESVNEYRYIRSHFMKKLNSVCDQGVFLWSELEKEQGMLERFYQTVEGFLQCYEMQKLDFFYLHIELYINLINQVKTRTSLIFEGCKATSFLDSENESYLIAILNHCDKAIALCKDEICMTCEE